jgi:carbonic anhydrase/acetyltransferase-like protein (isoleucine patch superfamily)
MAKNSETAEALQEPAGNIEADADGAAVRHTEGGLSLHFTFDMPKLPSINSLKDWSHQALLNAALATGLIAVILVLALDWFRGGSETAVVRSAPEPAVEVSPLGSNVVTSYNPIADTPDTTGAYVDPTARVTGAIHVGAGAYVGHFAALGSDGGQPIHIGENSNVQNLVVIGARPTFVRGKLDPSAFVTVPDEAEKYAVFIGNGVSLAAQSQVFGPALIGDGVYIGMQALVAEATLGADVVIEPDAIVIGVSVPAGRYVPAGSVITRQHEADALPAIGDDYPFRRIGKDTVEFYTALAAALGNAAPGEHGSSPSASH